MNLANLVTRHWLVLVLVSALGGLAAFGLSYLIEPAYRATVVMVPARDDADAGMLNSLPGAFGGLAGLAGISIGGDSGRTEALESLRSAAMAREFIEQEKIGPLLAEVLDDDASSEEALRFFRERVLDVSDDRRTNVVRLSVTWVDPTLAAAWANRYVTLTNATLQQRAVREAADRREYLERELQRSDLVELRAAAYRLIESQLKAAMLAVTRGDFAFRVVDPAVAPDPDDRIRPKRTLLSVTGALLAACIALIVLWLRRNEVGRA
jgi:LPS O-antigen subunit length determinant protein (WzzB/FepE family)